MTPTHAGSPGALLALVSQTGPAVTFLDAATHKRLIVLRLPRSPMNSPAHRSSTPPPLRPIATLDIDRTDISGAHGLARIQAADA
ncbi:hypothetical protein [Streptomyces halobius]|uniref:Uncharacterized protein n=1 Tax=Streptomyces halobius TaxID=2879846 RepID=A0ABY4M4Q2_9ACTN|nr:hypothetical protein [Streptomyces halobius]UQA92739.1 hypothetical protein K9S39_13690 [Streptomyces halobius]